MYGQSVIVETDHKPLLGVASKPLAEVSPRLQRMLLRCLRYQFKLIYKAGKNMTLADALSRASSPTLYAEHDERTEEQATVVVHQTIPTPVGRDRCRNATAQDPTMQGLKTLIHTGWPPNRKAVPDPVKPFWNVRYELTEKDGILLKGGQVVVPVTLRKSVLSSIHDGHLGIGKCIERAKCSVYWPGYVNDIQDMVCSCSRCQEHRNSNLPLHAIDST